MIKIGISKFARDRHLVRGTGKTFYRNSEPELICAIHCNWEDRKPGFGRSNLDEVVVVPMPAEQFVGNTAKVTEHTKLTAKLERRQTNEDPFIKVEAVDSGNWDLVYPEICKFASAVLYNKSILTPDELKGCEDCDWIVVCLTASPVENEPIHPVTMMRNFLKKPGGTYAPYTAEQFAEAIDYWSTRCSIGVKQ